MSRRGIVVAVVLVALLAAVGAGVYRERLLASTDDPSVALTMGLTRFDGHPRSGV